MRNFSTYGFQIIFLLMFLVQGRPLLLLLDGHLSHYWPETVHLAAAEQVIVFALPPNTTNLTHLWLKVVSKVCWKEACQDYTKKNPG